MDKKAKIEKIRQMTNLNPWNSSVQNAQQLYFDEDIQDGTSEFDKGCRAVINKVIKLIHGEMSYRHGSSFTSSKVVKGGSFGKGTMVKGISDVDLVVFMNEPAMEPIGTVGLNRYQKQLSAVLERLKSKVGNLGATNVTLKPFLLTFTIRIGGRSVDVDLLPTADNCSSFGNRDRMYDRMLQISADEREFYSVSRVGDQKDFVKEQPAAVKSLIRMVKSWADQSLPESLQKSYPLELLTIHLWERAGSPQSFKMARGFRCVIAILPHLHNQLKPVYWTKYYSKDKACTAINNLHMKNPIVLDPANPTNNVFKLYHDQVSRQDLARASSMTLSESVLMRNVGRVQRDRPNW